MQWAYYWSAVVRPYKVKLEGWPSDIPFGNLSDVATSLPTLEKLSRLLKKGQLHWKALTDAELDELEDKRNGQIEAGQIVERVRQPRSDKGKKHVQNVTGARRNKRGGGRHSNEVITDDSDKENEGNGVSSNDG